jgi:hypothetical protein
MRGEEMKQKLPHLPRSTEMLDLTRNPAILVEGLTTKFSPVEGEELFIGTSKTPTI